MRRTHWLWTLNNPTNDETVVDLENIFSRNPQVKYAMFQLEQGTEGTLHYQGYLELVRNQQLTYVRQLLPRAHWEPRRGTRQQAREYCMKLDTRVEGPWEIGDWIESRQGQRTDIQEIHRLINETNMPVHQIMKDRNYQQVRLIETLAKYRKVNIDWHPKEVNWYWGPTGTGKTRTAFEEMDPNSFWVANKTGDWFDGYQGETDVLIDDLRANDWKYNFMLKLLDGRDIRVPIKGSFTIFSARRIWITCPYKPEVAYAGQVTYHDNIAQLLRRITTITKFDLPNQPEEEEQRIPDDNREEGENWYDERLAFYRQVINQ